MLLKILFTILVAFILVEDLPQYLGEIITVLKHI